MGRANILRASLTRMSTRLNWESNVSMARWTPPGSASETATPPLLSPARPALGPCSKAFSACSRRSGRPGDYKNRGSGFDQVLG